MSDTDSFIEEVNEEVRRDRLYGYLRRYGWIALLAVVLIVGGAAWSEYRKAQNRAQAEGLGDAMLAALAKNDNTDRAAALAAVKAGSPSSSAVLRLLTAAEQVESGDSVSAVETLNAVAVDGEIPPIYRQIAQFKSVILQGDETPVAEYMRGDEIEFSVNLGEGEGAFTAWTSDLTHGYVDINADYRS